MTLNQLSYFQKVAMLENYHQAADELYISQPSLSRSMASLEEELGVVLFKKEGRGVVLTKAGRLFLEHVNKILEDCGVARNKMKEISGNGGKIDIGYVFPLAGRYIPHNVRNFLMDPENEGVVFNFWQNHTPAIAKKVRSGELDVGFGGCLERDGLEYYPLINQKMVIITPLNHELSDKESVPLDALGRYPVIGYDEECWMGMHLRALFKRYGVNTNLVVECPDEYSIVSLVRENFGIAIIPRTDILEGETGVSIHEIMNFDIGHQIYMFWSRDTYHLPAVDRFISYMKQQATPSNDTPSASKIYLKDIVNF